MSPEQLNEVKTEVQKILDNHLEDDQRFSIQDLDEESTFLLIDLLVEKDDSEREKNRNKIEKNILYNRMNLEITYEKILEIKDKLNIQKNEINDLKKLEELINTEKDLDEELNNI
jgi:hypothetical protein